MFKQVYSGLFIGSTILGITGLVQCWKTEGITRTLALTVGIAGTSGALVCAGLGIAYDGKHQSQQQEFDEKIQNIEHSKKAELNGLELAIKNLKSHIKTLEAQGTQHQKEISELKVELNLKAEQYLKIIAEKDLKISKLEGIVSQRDSRVADFLEESRGYVNNFLNLRYQSLDSLQKSLEKAIDNTDVLSLARDSFDRRINDIRELKGELLDALNEITTLDITDFKVVLDFIFRFDNKFLNIKVRWKDFQAKEVKTENTNLKTSLADSMPKAVALERFTDGINEVDVRITEKYEALLLNNNSIHAQLLDLLEQRNLVIDDLQRENDALQKPLLAVGTSDYALAANRVANYYYENYGYKLDVIHWVENETGYSVLYATRRNPGLTETELLPHNTREQLAAFTNCLEGTLPKFTFNYQHSTVTLDITLRKPPKKDNTKDDIDKIWVPVSKFESYVKRWERIRITAGSTGGKSPTAKNLALAIMNSRRGQGEIKLYDPQDGSKKDYWNMPKSGTSHADNLAGMKEVCKLIDERRHGSDHPFMLYIFDEVDNTVTQLKEGAKFKDLIKVSLKEGSHANVGVIYIGQSADANEVPGMTHSNWGNAVQLHIGSNAGAVIKTMKTLTAEDSEKLLKQYRKIQEYCEIQNEELGLDIFTDAGAYRFALAVPLTGLPKFIQLPPFDTYDYYEVMAKKEGLLSKNTQIALIANILNEAESEAKTMNVKAEIKCPHCGSEQYRSKGQRWLCLNTECGKTWVKEPKLEFS